MKRVIVCTVPKNDFAANLAKLFDQKKPISDYIKLNQFGNGEFCPQFLFDKNNQDKIGFKLKNKAIIIVNTESEQFSRNELAMRSYLIARAARENGAKSVILIEPDLFFSAQDQGPRMNNKKTSQCQNDKLIKFDGQVFSAKLHAELLKISGFDRIITVHNHSANTIKAYQKKFSSSFYNLQPVEFYIQSIREEVQRGRQEILLCAPDKGALDFVQCIKATSLKNSAGIIALDKVRKSEHNVAVDISSDSEIKLDQIKDKTIMVLDDMVRTGNTIIEACKLLRKGNPLRIVFMLTHFSICQEGLDNLKTPLIDKIICTNSIPLVSRKKIRDHFGEKISIINIEKWIAEQIKKTTILN